MTGPWHYVTKLIMMTATQMIGMIKNLQLLITLSSCSIYNLYYSSKFWPSQRISEFWPVARETYWRYINIAWERCFSSSHERGTKKKFWVPMRNRTSNLRIPRSVALPLSHRDSTVSEVYYEVHVTRVLHTARISNVDSIMFVNRIRKKEGKFWAW